jgi:purine nucleosidase
MRIHLDTDIGSDTDDACALAMLLGWPGVELVGITTTLDPGGRRAGFVVHCLKLAGREDIPVAAGAETSLTTLRRPGAIPDDERYWPNPVPSHPSRSGAALDLLTASIEEGATIVAIGPFTNLAVLEVLRPGSLSSIPVVVMGGWIHPPAKGLPQWGPEMDWNVQCDTRAAEILAVSAQLTLVTLPATLKAHLCAADLPRLRTSGRLGEQLASQAEAHAEDNRMTELGLAHASLPDDLLNFHYDPVACAVALGWPGTTVEKIRLKPVLHDGVLRFQPDKGGRPTQAVVDLVGKDFTETWLTAVEAAKRSVRG